ncbi:MAG: DtxR family iron (metal) dependent repressor [Desulfobacteraceae bacterium 4572_87]|nr:MAG: DtxR family iron (metal) dependent repressor [Desulfobacteraceae bacterium 4572_87]
MANVKNDKRIEKPVTSVMEDYLEAIFDLDQQKKVVRVKDIAKRLNVKMPTVTSMLKTLSKRGLVYYEKYEYVEPTQKGAEVGREMRRRHGILSRFLSEILKIKAKTADEEACRIEHSLSSGTLDSLTDFMAFIQVCPRVGENWLDHFEEYRQGKWTSEKCIVQSEAFFCEFSKRTRDLKEPEIDIQDV